MGLTVYGGGGKPEEEKTVTAGTSVIVVNPSSGKVMKKVTVNPTPTESKSVTPTTSELTVTPSEGKHLSQVVVGAVEDVTPEVTAQTPVITQILEGLVGKAQGANATADKILEGYSAYVGQELVEGTGKDLSKQVAIGEVTVTSESLKEIRIAHSIPNATRAILLPKEITGETAQRNMLQYFATKENPFISNYPAPRGLTVIYGGDSKVEKSTSANIDLTDTEAVFYARDYNGTRYWAVGTYIWIVLAQ